MDNQIPGGLAHHIRSMAALWQDDQRGDGELLAAFADAGDQSAFTALVGRHGATVWAVCRRILTDSADAEDAFQATFIALARKCRETRPESVPGWLARVAHDASLDVRKASRRREAAHRRLCEQARSEISETPDDEFRAAVHEELAGLPLGLRAPLALYYLEGKTQPEIGRLLGMPNQTVSHRIRRGLAALRNRLAKRGMVVTATVLVALLGGVPVALAVPSGLMASTVAAALQAATGSATPAAVPAAAGLVLSPLIKVLMFGLVVGVAVVIGFWACPSAGNHDVSGSVLMGQRPLERAEVVLVPDHGESRDCKAVRTLTDSDGRFRFAVGSGEGQVAPGRYRVLVLDQTAVKPKADGIASVPPDYRAPLETPLRLNVGDLPVVFDIPITPVFKPAPLAEPNRSPEWQFRLRRNMVVWVLPGDEFGQLER